MRLSHRLVMLALILSLSMLPAREVLAARGQPDPAVVSLEQYWDLVEQTRRILGEIQASPQEKVRAELDRLVFQWETVKQVELENGEIVSIDNSYLIQLLGAENANPAQVEALIGTLLDAHQEYPGRLFTTADLASLDEILSRPEFQWEEELPNPIEDWFNRLFEKIADWLGKIFTKEDQGATVSVEVPSIPLVPILTTILLVLAIAYVGRSLFYDFIADANLKGNGDRAEEILTAEAAFSRAQSLSRGGDHRSAVRFLYLSALLMLDERGLLRYDRSKTNREYLRSVSQSPDLAEPLQDVVDVFDNVWYGYHNLDEGSFSQYSHRVEELKEKKRV